MNFSVPLSSSFFYMYFFKIMVLPTFFKISYLICILHEEGRRLEWRPRKMKFCSDSDNNTRHKELLDREKQSARVLCSFYLCRSNNPWRPENFTIRVVYMFCLD